MSTAAFSHTLGYDCVLQPKKGKQKGGYFGTPESGILQKSLKILFPPPKK